MDERPPPPSAMTTVPDDHVPAAVPLKKNSTWFVLSLTITATCVHTFRGTPAEEEGMLAHSVPATTFPGVGPMKKPRASVTWLPQHPHPVLSPLLHTSMTAHPKFPTDINV